MDKTNVKSQQQAIKSEHDDSKGAIFIVATSFPNSFHTFGAILLVAIKKTRETRINKGANLVEDLLLVSIEAQIHKTSILIFKNRSFA